MNYSDSRSHLKLERKRSCQSKLKMNLDCWLCRSFNNIKKIDSFDTTFEIKLYLNVTMKNIEATSPKVLETHLSQKWSIKWLFLCLYLPEFDDIFCLLKSNRNYYYTLLVVDWSSSQYCKILIVCVRVSDFVKRKSHANITFITTNRKKKFNW